MVIKPTIGIMKKCNNIIEANKCRMKCVQENINNELTNSVLFTELENILKDADVDTAAEFISEKVFFQEIPADWAEIIIKLYSLDRKIIDELKSSYIKRGVKGIVITWGYYVVKGR